MNIDMSRFHVQNIRVHVPPYFLSHMGGVIRVFSTVPHVHTGEPVEICTQRTVVGVPITPALIRDVILEQLAHEVDECLKINGRQILDPHTHVWQDALDLSTVF